MMRWVILAVVVVGLSAAATVVVQSMSGEVTLATTKTKNPFPTAAGSGAKANGLLPRAVVEGDLVYDFGAKAQEQKFEKDFVIKNEGKGDLELTLSDPPCSCTVAGFQDEKGRPTGSKVVLPPGGKTTIHFTWETRNYNGKYEKPATLLTNDPEHPQLTFAAIGEVHPAVQIYPPEPAMNFADVSTDEEEHRMSVGVFSKDRPDFKITSVTSSRPDAISVVDEPMSDEEAKGLKVEKGRHITIKIKRGLPLGAFYEELVLKTDHPLQPEVKINVTGKVVGPISLTPERFRLVKVSGKRGGGGEVRILVRNKRETHFEVLHAPDGFKVDVKRDDTIKKPGRYLLTVAIPPGMPTGLFDDTIVLKTDHPHAGELKIPVGGYISDEN